MTTPLSRLRRARTDAARHETLTARFADSYVVRSQAIPQVRESLASFAPASLPERDSMFSLVVDARGFGLWADVDEPFLRVPWADIGSFALHSYVDYPIWDLLAVYEGHTTTALVAQVGRLPLQLVLWGDEQHDQTESLLDEYGVRTVLARIERFRPGAEPSSTLPGVAVTVTRLPRFTLRRR